MTQRKPERVLPARLVLPRLARGGDTAVILDGKDITDGVTSVTLHADVNSVTTLVVEYNCFEVTVDGDPKVIHVCPLADDEATK